MATYRQIETTDIDVLVAMMRDFYAIDGYPMEVEKSKKLFDQFISDENLGKSWLIFDAEKIVGYAILTFIFSFEFGGKIAFVDELYIKEEARGKGIGKQTIDFIKSVSEKIGLRLLFLEVETHNLTAKKLYFSKGFKEHNRQLLRFGKE